MEEVKRYSEEWNGLQCGCNSVTEDKDGIYVLYTDYAAEVADWAKSNKALAVELDTFRTEVNALRDERDSLRSQLEAASVCPECGRGVFFHKCTQEHHWPPTPAPKEA